ncbi:MAG: hypothetical protein AABY15_02625 [Nanoarchaeota archaeon]
MKRNPYLIQRLLKPYQIKEGQNKILKDNPFTFGGGLKNGGLSDEAMNLLREVWRYDYMGSAEFEWGAVPKSLDHIAKNNKEYIAGEISVKAKADDWNDGLKKVTVEAPVFYVCIKQDEDQVKESIEKLSGAKKQDFHTKESVLLAEAICKLKYREENAGWHDIDNHFLFFTDKEMFENFCKLFEIPIPNEKN